MFSRFIEPKSFSFYRLGAVGLAVIDACLISGATTVVGVDVNPAKEQFARLFGATEFINAAACSSLRQKLMDLTGGRGRGSSLGGATACSTHRKPGWPRLCTRACESCMRASPNGTPVKLLCSYWLLIYKSVSPRRAASYWRSIWKSCDPAAFEAKNCMHFDDIPLKSLIVFFFGMPG